MPAEGAEVRGEPDGGRRHGDCVEVVETDEGRDEVDEGDEDQLGVDPRAEGAQQGPGRPPENKRREILHRYYVTFR